MRFGLLELCLLVAIVAVLFGPAIMRKIKKYSNRYQTRNQRLQKVAAQRKAEQQIARELRNAKIKLVVGSVLGALAISSILYLAFWPTAYPVVSYSLDQDATLQAAFTSADNMIDGTVSASTIALEGYRNVTQVRFYNDWLYAVAEGGVILRVRENGTGLTELVATGGEITSFDFDAEDNIIFTDAAYTKEGGALLKASFDGFAVTVEPMISQGIGAVLHAPTAVAVAASGYIYFVDATTVPAVSVGGAEQALRTAQIAHTQDGVLYGYDPAQGSCEIMLEALPYVAGLALTSNEDALYLSVLTEASIWLVTVDTRSATLGAQGTEVFVSALPGYPAGLCVTEDGTLAVAFLQQTVSWFESLSALPAWREVMLRLPRGTQGYLLPYTAKLGQIATFAQDGSLSAVWITQEKTSINRTTSVCMSEETLYFVQGNRNEWIAYHTGAMM